MSWLKRAVVGMSLRRSGLDPRPVRVRVMVVKVTPGQLFLHMLRCFPNLNLITTVRWTSRRNLGTFKQKCAISDIGERWTENNFFYLLKYVRHSTRPLVIHDPLGRLWLHCTYYWSSREPERGSTPRRTDGLSNLDLLFKGLRLCGLFPSSKRTLNSRRLIVSGYIIGWARRQNSLCNEQLTL
jgi:hypothetical protein